MKPAMRQPVEQPANGALMKDEPPYNFRVVLPRYKAFLYLLGSLWMLLACVSQVAFELGYGANGFIILPGEKHYLTIRLLAPLGLPIFAVATAIFAYKSIKRFNMLEVTQFGIQLPHVFVSWDNYKSHNVRLGWKPARFASRPVDVSIAVHNESEDVLRLSAFRKFLNRLKKLSPPLVISITGTDHSPEFIDKMLCRYRDKYKRNW